MPAGQIIVVVPGAEPKSQKDPIGQATILPFVDVDPTAQVKPLGHGKQCNTLCKSTRSE